ncbi:hypothetical protein ACP4OV_023840 [Aristida adscensionis]
MAEILGSLCGATVGVVVKPVYDIFFKHTTYPFTTDRNIRDLAKASQSLDSHREDVQRQINLGRRDELIASDEASKWLKRVRDAISDGQRCEQMYGQRRRIFRCCHPNCWSNYKISKKAARALREINDCISSKPTNVTVQPVPPSVQERPLSYTEQQPSRVAYLLQAMKYIKDDPAGIIGIWGLGGVGKTYLLTQINNSFIGDSLFDSVVFVTASKEASTKKIQAEIVKKLGLREDDDVESQATIIFNFLKTRNFLLLLDDIWSRIDLQAVGIPPHHGSANRPKRKAVLTTRSKTVCGLMEVRKYIDVACLPKDEAVDLFQSKVGQETLSYHPRIESLAKELVNELKGLPLALITVGTTMHSKTDPVEWEFAIDYMKKSCCDDDDSLPMEVVLRRLKFSYDSLRNDTLRRCFLTCSLWPEDCVIHIEELLQCWMGIGLVDDCMFAGGSLAVSVKMHDVVRDMAIWIAYDCGTNNAKWVVHAGLGADSVRNFRQKKDSSRNTIHSREVECISLIGNEMIELPPFGPNHCLTELKTLYLQWNAFDERTIGVIRSFTALTYLDLSSNWLKQIPEELCALTNLECLNLSNNEQITEVPVRLGELTKLRFLFLSSTGIKYMPTEVISSLTELQVLDLITNYRNRNSLSNVIQIIEVLGTFTNLKAVDIGVARDVEYEILCKKAKFPVRDLIIKELIQVPVFCLSGVTFPCDILRRTLYELTILDSQMEQIILGDEMEKPFDALIVLVLANLHTLKEVMWKGISPQALFPKLVHLRLYNRKLQHISWAMYLPCLEYLYVSGCRNVEQAFLSTEDCGVKLYRGEESSSASIGTFPCLKNMDFTMCGKLARLCDFNVAFPSLESLRFSQCPQLTTLSFKMESLPPNFQKLVMDRDSAWNALEWEDEEVKQYLRHFLTTALPRSKLRAKYELRPEPEVNKKLVLVIYHLFIFKFPPRRSHSRITFTSENHFQVGASAIHLKFRTNHPLMRTSEPCMLLQASILHRPASRKEFNDQLHVVEERNYNKRFTKEDGKDTPRNDYTEGTILEPSSPAEQSERNSCNF